MTLGGDLDVAQVAELPQLLGCAGVPEDRLVDLEGVQFCGSMEVDRVGKALDESAELLFVVGGDLLSGRPALRLRGHRLRLATLHPFDDPAALGCVAQVPENRRVPRETEHGSCRDPCRSPSSHAVKVSRFDERNCNPTTSLVPALTALVLHICNINLDW